MLFREFCVICVIYGLISVFDLALSQHMSRVSMTDDLVPESALAEATDFATPTELLAELAQYPQLTPI